MDNTIIQQGRFTADGENKILVIRSDVDWMKVINYTVADDDTQTTAVGVEYYWQRGMGTNGIEYKKSNAANAAQLTTAISSAFNLIDSSANPVGAAVAESGITNVTKPVVSTADTSGLVAGDIVRISGETGAENLGGIDWQIDTVIANTSFAFGATLANAPGAAGTGGFYRKIKFDPLYYPRYRFLANITAASSAVVTTTVDHGYTVGQEVRFKIPAAYGMIELDGLSGAITAVTSDTFTVNIDSSGFTAFTFPLVASYPFDFAQVIPLGEDTAEALSNSVNILGDATVNTGYIGMELTAGTNAPAGASSDVIYWVAGKSFSVDNQ